MLLHLLLDVSHSDVSLKNFNTYGTSGGMIIITTNDITIGIHIQVNQIPDQVPAAPIAFNHIIFDPDTESLTRVRTMVEHVHKMMEIRPGFLLRIW